MDFGFYLPCYYPDTSYPPERLYQDMLEQARQADDLGFPTASIPEHHFINYLVHPSPLLTAIKVAENTKHLRLLIAVLVLPFYDMRRLAGEVAQTDCLTMGRVEFGVGRGAFQYEFDRLGQSITDSRERFVDLLLLLLKLLDEENVTWKSPYSDIPEPLTIMPRPYQKPRPPIWVAALSSEAIASTVKHGFPVMTTPLRGSFAVAKEQADAFTGAVAEVGPAAEHLRLSMLRMVYVAKDEADKREKVRLGYENHRRFTNVRETPGTVHGGAIQPVEDTNVSMDDVASALIIGTAQEVTDTLKKYADVGIHDIQANFTFGAEHKDVMGSVERFAKDVMPHFA